MTMDSWGGEDSAALFAQQEEEARLERERLAAYQAAPLPPPPPTTGQVAGNFFGQQFQQPPPPVGDLMAPLMPPAPPSTPLGVSQNLDLPSMTVDPSQAAWWTSPTAQNLLSAPSYSGDTPIAAPNYTGVYGPRDVLGEAAQGIGNGALRGAIGAAGDVLSSPALNFLPGGNLLTSLGVPSPSVADVYNSDIPVISPISRDIIQPAAGFIGEQGGQYLNTIGGGLPNQIMGAIGAPSYQELGRGGAEAAVPITLGDYALNALLVPKGAGLAERVTGFGGLDDLARTPVGNVVTGARDAVGNYATDFLNPGMFSPEALGGREAAAVQLRGGLPVGAGNQGANDWVRYVSNPADPVKYPASPDFPLPVDPNDPIAAVRGTPVAPPEVDPWRASLEAQGINVDAELARQGLGPQAIPENLPAPPDIYGRTFYDQPEVGPARVGLPADPFARPDVAGSLEQRMAGRGTPVLPNETLINPVGNEAWLNEQVTYNGPGPANGMTAPRRDWIEAQQHGNEMYGAADEAVGGAGFDWRNYEPAGGGTPPAPTAAEAGLAASASPPPASLTDAEINAMQKSVRDAAPEDMITLYRGDSAEATASMGQRGIDTGSSLASDPETAMLFARRIDPENPRVTEFQVPRSQVSEKEFYFTANEPLFPGAVQATPSPPAGGAHWFDDPRFHLIDEADPPPMTFQQLLENSRGGAGGGIPPTGAVPPAAATPPPPGGPPGAAAAGPTGAREEYFSRLRAERDAAGGAPPPPTPPANPIAAAGPPPSVAANPQAASLWDNMMDLLYGPLQMDVGTPFRQNLSATLDLSKIGRTREVLGDAVLAASGRAEAVRVMLDLDQMVADAAKSIGHEKPNLHLPDIPGVKVIRGNVGREVNQSNLFGQIPGIGAAYNVTGRANAMVLYSQRARDYVDFVKNLPDRAFATKDASKWAAQAQYFADQRAVTSGRGSLGGGSVERVLARAGPLFTSLRYMLSLPERVPYLIPVNRVAAGQWEVFGPAWREAAKEHAFFGAALAGTYAAADKAGLSIKDKDGDYTGKIKAGPVSFDLTGGASQYWNTIQRMADGDLKAGAEFLRNKSGPGVQAIAQGLKLAGVEGKAIDFMRPDWFDKGATGTGFANRSGKGTDADRALALILPLWMQSTAKAYRAAEMSGKNPWNAAATAGAADFVGINTRANPENTRTPALNSAMADPENLKGLPPNVVEFLTGKDWTAATPDEQRAIRANLSPEKLAEVERGEQQLRDRNDIFQAGRDQSKQIADTAAAKRAELAPVADKLLADWNAGRDPSKTVAQMKQIEKAADEAANKVYTGTQRIYDSKEYQDKIKDFPDKGAAQKEVDQIRELSKQYNDLYNDKRVVKADGSRDYDKLGAMQAAMLDVIRKDDPGFATRLEFNLQPNPANSFELTHQIKAIESTLDKKGYYDVPTGFKTQYAREHPDVDALLSWLYGNPVHSQSAAQILQSLAPQRTVTFAR